MRWIDARSADYFAQLTDRLLKRLHHGRDGYAHFDAVFYVSGRSGHGCPQLRQHLIDAASKADQLRMNRGWF